MSNNIIQIIDNDIGRSKYMWQNASNTYLKTKYNHISFYEVPFHNRTTYDDNICKYYGNDTFKIINHKLFKNICIIIQIIFKKLKF